jgi:hypothetical protein
LLFLAALATPAHAQFYDVARRSLNFSLDAIERSPRLLGMGRMTFVGDDPQTAITLWDFALNPIGVLDADSSSTLELYPATSSASDVVDTPGDPILTQRQDLAARESRVAYEVWRRVGRRTAYGFAGDLGQLRMDGLYADGIERRSTLSQPTVMPVMTGHVPFVRSDHWLYALRLFYSGEGSTDEYRNTIRNSMGEYVNQDGTQLDPPEFFTPTDYQVRSTGGGIGLGYDRGRALRIALAVDQVQNQINGSNDGGRRSAKTDEKRPISRGQATLVGHLGRDIEWGVDGRTWASSSEEHWLFTISGGIGANPLEGRGKLLEREARGRTLQSRARWKHGPFEVGGGVSVGYQRNAITPPGSEDPTSFNHFLSLVNYWPNADSLALPDSVLANVSEERAWEAGGGLSFRLPGGRGLWGIEYHRQRRLLEQTLGGPGPLARGWDVRTGLEFPCTSVMTGRAGYARSWLDRDVNTSQNEYLANTLTLGIGLKPSGAMWTFEAGYAIAWHQADYGSPAEPHGSLQQLTSLLRWAF